MVNWAEIRKGARRWVILAALALFASIAFAAPQRSVAYFPFGLGDNAFSPEGYSLEEALTKGFLAEFSKDKRFSVNEFSRSNPGVKRALNEGSIPASLLLAPFTGRQGSEFKGITLGKLMRAEVSIAGIAEKLSYDAAKKTSDLVVSLEIFDVKAGKVLGIVSLTAKGTGEDKLSAAKSAVADFIKQGVSQVIAILTAPPKPKPSGGWK